MTRPIAYVVHHVPKHTIHEDLIDIGRQGELIIACFAAGDRVTVITVPAGSPDHETRLHKIEELRARIQGDTHRSRLGVGGDAA